MDISDAIGSARWYGPVARLLTQQPGPAAEHVSTPAPLKGISLPCYTIDWLGQYSQVHNIRTPEHSEAQQVLYFFLSEGGCKMTN